MLQNQVIKKLFGALALLPFCCRLAAGTVSVYNAQEVALNFYKTSINFSNRNLLDAVLSYTQTEANGTVTFYVFNIKPVPGFVIISADDRVRPVLAYSTETNFNTGFKNTGLANWIESRSAEINYIIQNKLQADTRTTDLWRAYEQGVNPLAMKNSGVPPLCGTIWNQENTASTPPPYLYNLFCSYNSGDQQRCLTGCVATAMAQIMKYWNYPVQGSGSYTYDDNPVNGFSNSYGTQSANFGNTYYQWAEMPNSLNMSCSAASDSAISLLMYQCGVAIATDYGDDNQHGSGAFLLQSDAGSGQPCAQAAFSTYFSYNASTIQGVQKTNYNSVYGWIDLIENELNADRPVAYQGTGPTYGSHAWVCDGYDQNDNLHMNWGWSGEDDGFFSINSLNPLSYDFSQDDEALIGIQPSLSLQVGAQSANSSVCPGNSTTLTAQGPVNATYSWYPTNGLSCSNCATTDAYPYYTTTYTVTVDSSGYTGMASVTIIADSYIDVDIGDAKDVSCHGLSDGLIALAVSGGTGAYSYLWNNGQTADSINNLSAGNYSVTVTDILSCTGSGSKNISQPGKLYIDLSPTNGLCGGNISAYVSGGTQGYNYEWSNGARTAHISQLPGATYTLTVTDSHDCMATASANVNGSGLVAVNPEITDVSCFGDNNGSITLDVSGGTAPYNYSWSNNGQNDSLSNLAAGTYSVTVYDNNNCSVSENISIVQPDEITITTTYANTSGGQNNGTASVSNVTGGTPPYSYSWSTGQSDSGISNLAQGAYTVTVTDSKGCQQSVSVYIKLTSGISSPSATFSFSIYPNPAKTDMVLQLDNLDNETILSFKNVLGQELFTKTITGLNTTINLSPFANGVYFAQVMQGEKMAVREIVINK